MSQNKLSLSPTAQVVETVNTLGLSPAARQLGTSAATLSRWLKNQDYRLKRVYVKEAKS